MVLLCLGLIHTLPTELTGADNTLLKTKAWLKSPGEKELTDQNNRAVEEHSVFKS